MNVSAIIVTRGDHDLTPVLDSLPPEWEQVVWDNGAKNCRREHIPEWAPVGVVAGEGNRAPAEAVASPRGWAFTAFTVPDVSVYGRFAAIEYASGDLIYVQDDDVIVSDPQAIVDTFLSTRTCWEHNEPMTRQTAPSGHVVWACDKHEPPRPCVLDEIVANMPQEFRHDGYTDSCLVGFGSCFHRDLPERSFSRLDHRIRGMAETNLWFQRTCDVVFTTLTHRVLVDVPKTDREFASDPDRMWRQPDHVGERTRMLELARKVRDG